jgi:hypothetical protein
MIRNLETQLNLLVLNEWTNQVVRTRPSAGLILGGINMDCITGLVLYQTKQFKNL